MSPKTRSNANLVSDGTNTRIASLGETFDDSAMIELVSGPTELSRPHLLLWNRREMSVGPSVEHGGRTYEAPGLPPSLYRATRLPSGCSDYGSARGLFAEIRDLFERHLSLPELECSLLACFAISTWLVDRLPSAPGLTISGPDEEVGMDALRLLSCVCRHPLLLAEITPGSFRSLPMRLFLTLLLNQEGLSPTMRRLFRASSYRGLHLAGSKGSVVDLYGPKAILVGNDAAVDRFSSGAIHISAAPSESRPSVLNERVQNKIATNFQPRLLMYRLRNIAKVSRCQVDVSQLALATRQLARILAACFPDDSKLANDTVQLVRQQEAEIREQHSLDVNCAILEILWGMIHHRQRRKVMVDEFTKDVNSLLASRGEILKYSAEQIGWKLHGMSIPRHSTSKGRQIVLERKTSQRVHQVARSFALPCAQSVETNCPDCSPKKSANSK